MPHNDQRPTTDSAQPTTGVLAVDALIQGIQATEAALIALEQLVAGHVDGSAPTTHDTAEAAIHAFTDAWQATSSQALEQAARLTANDKAFAATRPTVYRHAAARKIAETVGVMLIERSQAAQACLLYLQGAAGRAQVAVARLAATDKDAKE